MLAYVSWHRPAPGVERDAYEHALERFHRSLAHRPPSGYRGSTSFRAGRLPWLGSGPAGALKGDSPDDGGTGTSGAGRTSSADTGGDYEDWYLLDGWNAVGVIEEAAVAQGHTTAHDAIAQLAGPATSSVYRLGEGHARLADTRLSVWVSRARGHASPTIADLLGDGMDRRTSGMWRRCLGLGPAPEYCVLACDESSLADLRGVAESRLPTGWEAAVCPREVLWSG
jgi:hypothetical protein